MSRPGARAAAGAKVGPDAAAPGAQGSLDLLRQRLLAPNPVTEVLTRAHQYSIAKQWHSPGRPGWLGAGAAAVKPSRSGPTSMAMGV